MISMVLRTVIIYLFLITVIRLMGKRQIGELQLSELVTTLLLSELAAQPITDSEIPLLYAVIPIVLLLSLEIILSFCVTKATWMKKLLNGAPSFLINHGTPDLTEIKRARLSVEELLTEVRLKGFTSLEEVDYAILEQNGKISIIPKVQYAQPQNVDLKISPTDSGIAHILISDGAWNRYNLTAQSLDTKEIEKMLKEKGVENRKDVFLFCIDDVGHTFLIRKDHMSI